MNITKNNVAPPNKVRFTRRDAFETLYASGFVIIGNPMELRLVFNVADLSEQQERVANASDEEARNVERSKLNVVDSCEIILPTCVARSMATAILQQLDTPVPAGGNEFER